MEATRAWEDWHRAGKTDAVTGRWFREKPPEELYDTWEDPDNVVNLIDDPAYQRKLINYVQLSRIGNWRCVIVDYCPSASG